MPRVEVDGETREIPKIWSMVLPEGHLVFDLQVVDVPGDPDYPGFYSIYRFEADRPADASLWAAIEGMEPVGRIPASDVEPVDRSLPSGIEVGFQLHTMGIERFATS